MPSSKEAPPLSAEWINRRIENVYTQAAEILEHLLDDMTSSGYLPFESPPTSDTMKRLTPQQKTQLGMVEPQEGPNRPEQLPIDVTTPPPNMIEALPEPAMPLATENTAL